MAASLLTYFWGKKSRYVTTYVCMYVSIYDIRERSATNEQNNFFLKKNRRITKKTRINKDLEIEIEIESKE